VLFWQFFPQQLCRMSWRLGRIDSPPIAVREDHGIRSVKSPGGLNTVQIRPGATDHDGSPVLPVLGLAPDWARPISTFTDALISYI
jgi:hypothetical protein